MNKAKLFVLGMSLGFNRDHEIFEGIDFDEDMADLLQEGSKITKADIFSTAPNGKCIFEYKETWEKLDKVLEIAKKNGEQIDLADLQKNIQGTKSALDMAISGRAVSFVLAPELWVGKIDEFEELFFSVSRHERNGMNHEDIKEKIAALSGVKTRATELKDLGIPPSAVRAAFNAGNLDTFLKQLEEKGTHIKLEDIKLVDIDGDHCLHTKASWEKFDRIYAALEAAGEIPDEAFFFFCRSDRRTVIESAFFHSLEDKVFNATVFKGRPEVLMTVYERLDESQQSKIDIDKILMDVIEAQINMDFLTSDQVGLDDLLAPLFNAAADNPVMTLGLKKTWEYMDGIVESLKAKGQFISLKSLRQLSGKGDESCLMKAARYKHFDKVMNIMMTSGERLTPDDLLTKPEDGKSLLEIIQDNDGVEALLNPAYWSGHSDELINVVWENLNEMSKTKYKDEMRQLLTRCNIDALRGQSHAPTEPISSP